MITNVEVRIVRRVDSLNRPFSEIFYEFDEDGEARRACSRTWAALDDTPMARAQERQQFMRRQARPYSDGSMP